MDKYPGKYPSLCVTSYAEVWIEMLLETCIIFLLSVTSYAEVWIEIEVYTPCSRKS